MLICVLSLCCGGVAADVCYVFALLPLYGVRLVTDTILLVSCRSQGKRAGRNQARITRNSSACVTTAMYSSNQHHPSDQGTA